MESNAPRSALIKALATLGQRPPAELAGLAGGPALRQALDVGGERVEIEMLVAWDDASHDAVRITGHAHGPEGMHGHVQESLVARVRDADRPH